jgi:hypothetical protein
MPPDGPASTKRAESRHQCAASGLAAAHVAAAPHGRTHAKMPHEAAVPLVAVACKLWF